MTVAKRFVTLEEVDAELLAYRTALRGASPEARSALWEQIDRLLEHRHRLARALRPST